MASVKRRPNGQWRARYDYLDDGGKRREHAKHFRTKAAGEDWIVEELAKRQQGTWTTPTERRTTLRGFYDDWSPRQIWASSTRDSYNITMNDCTFDTVEVGKLRRSHVEAWVKDMQGRLAPGTIKTRVGNVRTVIRAAMADRVLTVDPSIGVRLPRTRRAEVAMVIPTPEQVGAIVNAAESWFRPFVALAAFAGLRIGEVAGVQQGDIAFLKRTLQVSRQVQKEPGTLAVIPPKHGSERKVYLPDALVTMLSEHVANIGVHGDEGWLLPGRPPNPDSLRWHWNKTLEAAGVIGFTPHDMRHYYASGLIAHGADVVTVQRALGHAKASTTLNTYSHLWGTAEDVTRAAAADLMTSSLAPADSLRTPGADTA
ncbi:site-specific integrase [Curtobacterium sp. MCPF17_018]|uniref:tyrosine-type recombinase/integrase n=1 Tax=Curtobacterium sp. MCPF17_018 TaxID=2175638 RepID=UPI000DA780B8|nr:site-specific integrase [Curtobacterium sp. MCPF17_018]PZE71767.1 site-specific integrase [Curtobacterium sp. MCPF17_018]